MATLKEEIFDFLSRHPGLTDREVTSRLKGPHAPQQPVNQACRQLEANGALRRARRHDGLIGNYPTGGKVAPPALVKGRFPGRAKPGTATDQLPEDAIKEILVKWLEKQGWSVEVAWGKTRGADCVAVRGDKRWIIEVKGCGSRQPMRVNYFLAILGETLQRMDDPDTRYSIALPDMAQFRGLWERLPQLAKDRTQLTALFACADGQVREER